MSERIVMRAGEALVAREPSPINIIRWKLTAKYEHMLASV